MTFQQTKSAGYAIHKGWVARITGRDETYGFAREFVKPASFYQSGSGKKIAQEWTGIADGVYEVRNLTSHDDGFYRVSNGAAAPITKAEVL